MMLMMMMMVMMIMIMIMKMYVPSTVVDFYNFNDF